MARAAVRREKICMRMPGRQKGICMRALPRRVTEKRETRYSEAETEQTLLETCSN